MLDQNTTTVLTTLITVSGTLGGVILGVVLSNRYVARQDKAKRNTQVIEEVYSLLTKIHDCSMDNITYQRGIAEGLTDDLGRVKTLIHLYLPSMKAPIDNVLKKQDDLSIAMWGASNDHTQEENRTIMDKFKQYNLSIAAAQEALEKLVR